LGEEKGGTDVPLFAHARVGAGRSSRQGEPWIRNTSSHDPWVGTEERRLGDIHSIDDR
jgi:hypothetical protein